jgi:hypothetical protein
MAGILFHPHQAKLALMRIRQAQAAILPSAPHKACKKLLHAHKTRICLKACDRPARRRSLPQAGVPRRVFPGKQVTHVAIHSPKNTGAAKVLSP